MELVPDYLICSSDSPPNPTHHVWVCSIASLSDSWIPLGDHNTDDPVRLLDIPRVASTTIELKGTPDRTAAIAVRESPLRPGTYRVWFYITYFEPSPRVLRGPTLTRRDLLCRFRLSLPATGGYQLTWRQQSSTLVECANRLGGISYSGHATTFRRRRPAASQQILPPEIAFVPILVGIPGGMDGALMDVQVAPFSGALSWSTDHSAILCYYK